MPINLLLKSLKGQLGFTLIEMIVVVGIIAVLAAAIMPNVAKFIGTGEDGAKSVELDHVEDAFELMMAQQHIVAVTAHDSTTSSTATNAWTALPVGGPGVVPLSGFLVDASTSYYYCYDASGLVSEQFETATPCTLP